MQIFIKLYGNLKDYAPGDRPHFTLRLDPGATLADLYRVLAIADVPHVVLINGRRSSKAESLSDGDTLVFMPPISGG